MTKAEIIEKLAEEIKITKAAAGKALTIVTDSIAQSLRKGNKVSLVGFGRSRWCSARQGKAETPRTGKRSRSPRGKYQSSSPDRPEGSGRRKSPCQESRREESTGEES